MCCPDHGSSVVSLEDALTTPDRTPSLPAVYAVQFRPASGETREEAIAELTARFGVQVHSITRDESGSWLAIVDRLIEPERVSDVR